MRMERFARRLGGSSPRAGIGIDIGASQIKVVVCTRTDSGIQVTEAWVLPVPSPEDEQRATFRDQVSQWLREAVRQGRRSGDTVIAVSLPASQVTLATIPLLPVPAGHAPDLRLLDVGPYLTFPPSEAVYDIQPFSGVSGRPPEAFLAAIPRATAHDYCQELADIGVDPHLLDVTTLANANLIAPLLPDGQVVAVVDIGAQSAEVTLLEGQRFRGAISFSGAGDDLTDALTVDFLGDMKRAETAKHERGLLDVELRPAVRRWRDDLLHSIAEAIATCESEHGLKRLDRVVLFGGSATIRGLRGALEDYLETPVAIGNPWHSLQVAAGATMEPHPAFSVATGLALRALGQGTFRINLRPRRLMSSRVRERKPESTSLAIWGLAVIVPLMLLAMVSLNIQRNYLKTLEGTLPSLQTQAARALEQQKAAEEHRIARARLIRQEQAKPRWSFVLEKLFASLPPGVSLTSLSWEKGKAISASGRAASYSQAVLYIINLEHTGRFQSISLQQTQKSGAGIVFTLKVFLKEGGS